MVPAQRAPSVPVTSSFDEIVRNWLFVVGTCLLNNKPQGDIWGGKINGGSGYGMLMVIQGTLKSSAPAGSTGNGTLDAADIALWDEEPSSS